MENKIQVLCVVYYVCLIASTALTHGSKDNERKPYVVYMGDVAQIGTMAAKDNHHNLLVEAIGDERIARNSIIHSYGKSFNAFAAMLKPEEIEQLKEKEGVLSVIPNKIRKLHTTRSWDFIGMPLTVKRNYSIESNIIVGLLDTGIWVDSPSFNDRGYGPPPAKWKGICHGTGPNFSGCNKKVIGARYYNLDKTMNITNPTIVDTVGHGTHTSSTVAGNSVSGAHFYGLGNGIGRGGVPSARIAMYKVCWAEVGCSDMDILAALDDAIDDGVDVLSLSLGGINGAYSDDVVSIGTFHAMKRGILPVCSGGNSGPQLGTVSNIAPWILTVAATTTDRHFITPVRLGNGETISGASINAFSPRKEKYPLTSGTLANNNKTDGHEASACYNGTLDASKVKGKIIFCGPGELVNVWAVEPLGPIGTIMALYEEDYGSLDSGFSFALPTSVIKDEAAGMIDAYITSTRNPEVVILKSQAVKRNAPFLVHFSSRGPNPVSKNILKPDISAPGSEIIAAWSKFGKVNDDPLETRNNTYNIISGTSMACPHVAAAAVYVKTFHPHWSPAAIKSALMTTAREINNTSPTNFDESIGYGSGQIDPVKAIDPGLVYDMNQESYISFLCREGYDTKQIASMGANGVNCETQIGEAKGFDGLNYPSMSIALDYGDIDKNISAVFERTVTNVGFAKSVYKATVKSPEGLNVTVIPDILVFDQMYQKKSFKVVLKGGPIQTEFDEFKTLAASLVWTDSLHIVRSPILVYYFPIDVD